MENTYNEWIKLSLYGKTEDIEILTAVISMIENGVMIEDYSDVSTDGLYGALIDESILSADREHVTVSVFLSADRNLSEAKAFLSERIATLGLDAEIKTEGMKEEDWAEAWKKYYHPIRVGRVTVVPAWEEYTPKEGERILRMDPGMAFGTGTHETTRLVMEMLSEEIRGGERLLDVGTGSGILALCAAKLGAEACYAYDIDPMAVRVARENVEKDGAQNVVCGEADLLSGLDRTAPYDFVVANIVADIILRLLPDLGEVMREGGRAILSGIIGERVPEIRRSIAENGFTLVREACERDWYAILIQKN